MGLLQTKGDLLNYIDKCAVVYSADAIESIKRNKRMHKARVKIDQTVIDAVLVDFVNYIGRHQGLDYGLYAHYLEESRELLENPPKEA